MFGKRLRANGLDQCQGFTLIELVIVIVVLAIVSAVAIPYFGDITENAKVTSTREEMNRLRVAIIGDPRVTASGAYINCGYLNDVGFAPSALVDLVSKPDSVAPYNKFTRQGWNGPYIDSAGGEYLTDAWGAVYSYDPNTRTITSTGGAGPLTISF